MSLVELTARAESLLDFAARRNLPAPYDLHINKWGDVKLLVTDHKAVGEWARDWPESGAVFGVDGRKHELTVQWQGEPIRVVGFDHGQVIL